MWTFKSSEPSEFSKWHFLSTPTGPTSICVEGGMSRKERIRPLTT